MPNEMVMRSVYLRPEEDAALRQLAFEIEVTKSDLIRSAISAKLEQWLQSDSTELVLKDVELGKRPSRADRASAARSDAKGPTAEQSGAAPAKASSTRTSRTKAAGGDAQQGSRSGSGKKTSTSQPRNGSRQPNRTSDVGNPAPVAVRPREPALAG